MPNTADEFLSHHRNYCAEVRTQSETDNPKLLEARGALLSAIASHQSRVQGMSYKPTDGRMHLVAQCLQGLDLSYSVIVDGLYPQAANLQKQQIETIAALEEIRNGLRIDRKTPNVKHARLRGFGRQYGALNEIAHPAVQDVVELLAHYDDGERQGPTIIPQFRKQTCTGLLAFHCILLLHLWNHASEMFELTIGVDAIEDEFRQVKHAMTLLQEGGFI